MALVPDTRQYPCVAYLEFTYADIPTTATAYTAVAVPVGSILTEIELYVTTSWAGGTHDLDIGDATDDDEYSGTICELDGAAGFPANQPAVSGFQTTLDEPDIVFTPTHSTAATAGAARFYCEYITEGRFHENFE
jgi:hypothetical protein